jgi:hypothetical protein
MSHHNSESYGSDNEFSEMGQQVSSPSSANAGISGYGDGYGNSERSSRSHLSKSQGSLDDASSHKRNHRFSKRASRNGLDSAF